jgi:hypothetical protein
MNQNLTCFHIKRKYGYLLPPFFAIKDNLLQNENDKKSKDNYELGNWVIDLGMVSVLDLIQNMVEGFVNI